MQNCFLVCFFYKSGHKCFDRSVPFLQIRPQIFTVCNAVSHHGVKNVESLDMTEMEFLRYLKFTYGLPDQKGFLSFSIQP